MLRLSGFPLNHYFNPQIFPPVPNAPAISSLAGMTPTGTNGNATQLQTQIGLSVTDVSKHSETLRVHSPVIVPNRTGSPKISSSPSSTASAPSVSSPMLPSNFLPKLTSPKKEPSIRQQEQNKGIVKKVSKKIRIFAPNVSPSIRTIRNLLINRIQNREYIESKILQMFRKFLRSLRSYIRS